MPRGLSLSLSLAHRDPRSRRYHRAPRIIALNRFVPRDALVRPAATTPRRSDCAKLEPPVNQSDLSVVSSNKVCRDRFILPTIAFARDRRTTRIRKAANLPSVALSNFLLRVLLRFPRVSWVLRGRRSLMRLYVPAPRNF